MCVHPQMRAAAPIEHKKVGQVRTSVGDGRSMACFDPKQGRARRQIRGSSTTAKAIKVTVGMVGRRNIQQELTRSLSVEPPDDSYTSPQMIVGGKLAREPQDGRWRGRGVAGAAQAVMALGVIVAVALAAVRILTAIGRQAGRRRGSGDRRNTEVPNIGGTWPSEHNRLGCGSWDGRRKGIDG